MKAFKNILALTVLMFTANLFADKLTTPETLADGTTVIPAGSDMIVGEDGTVQYLDEEGVILASVKTTVTPNGTTIAITKRTSNGKYVLVYVYENGTISAPVEASAPTKVTVGTGGGVGGSAGTQGPTGLSIPNNPATVI